MIKFLMLIFSPPHMSRHLKLLFDDYFKDDEGKSLRMIALRSQQNMHKFVIATDFLCVMSQNWL